jgi:hypothetical protein
MHTGVTIAFVAICWQKQVPFGLSKHPRRLTFRRIGHAMTHKHRTHKAPFGHEYARIVFSVGANDILLRRPDVTTPAQQNPSPTALQAASPPCNWTVKSPVAAVVTVGTSTNCGHNTTTSTLDARSQCQSANKAMRCNTPVCSNPAATSINPGVMRALICRSVLAAAGHAMAASGCSCLPSGCGTGPYSTA